MNNSLEKISLAITRWIGKPVSILIHSILFVAIFGLRYVGFTTDQILLILTTAVSLEAIYLAIFIQMTVNRHAEQIEEVGEDIEGIQDEVRELGEDVQEISEDVEEISEDIDVIQKEQAEDGTEEERTQATLLKIEAGLQALLKETEVLKHKTNGSGNGTSQVGQ
ncbi:MAG: hypothetical protein HYR95_01360 [Candidatus Colwellbacteria bacterium]|nr:hypothetical protein [Candidatus Colwellbacteria bacterium]